MIRRAPAAVRYGSATLLLALLCVLFASPGLASSPQPAPGRAARVAFRRSPEATASAPPQWLSEINRYRVAAGLTPVANDRAWDAGIRNHLRYLQLTPKRYLAGKYANAHSENPASPYYTAAGAKEAGYSDLDEGLARGGVQAIDVWLTAPFHAIGMLRPGLRRVALAWDSKSGYAGLDVIHGLDPAASPAAPGDRPVLFPGPGVTTNLTSFGGESPDPLQTCHWVGKIVGLPLIAMLAHPPQRGLSATLTTGAQTESTANRKLCVVDARTFHSTDRVYGPTGLVILKDDNAVLLIPRNALHSGSYTAQIKQPGQAPVRWQFAVRAG